MGQAPQDYNVQTVVSAEAWQGDEPMVTFEIMLAEVPGRTLKVHTKQADPPVEEGPIKGWLDLSKGKLGRALDRPRGGSSQASAQSSNGAGRTDATGRSIERQVSAKIAGELMATQGFERATFPQDFRFFTDAIHDAISGESDPDSQVSF